MTYNRVSSLEPWGEDDPAGMNSDLSNFDEDIKLLMH